jgi:hypothetical protein
LRFLNRAKLLWSFFSAASVCPRETHPQPKEDMNDAVFDALIKGAARTGEHMMLIGLGEPLLAPKIC